MEYMDFADCVAYLYPDGSSASEAERFVGTGVVVGVPFMDAQREAVHLYVITADHVLIGGVGAVRLRGKDGTANIVEVPFSDWELHPDGEDLAAFDLGPSFLPHEYVFVNERRLLTQEIVSVLGIGIGSEVLLLTRHVDDEGRQKETPFARFGNIAMMAHEKIRQKERSHSQQEFSGGFQIAAWVQRITSLCVGAVLGSRSNIADWILPNGMVSYVAPRSRLGALTDKGTHSKKRSSFWHMGETPRRVASGNQLGNCRGSASMDDSRPFERTGPNKKTQSARTASSIRCWRRWRWRRRGRSIMSEMWRLN